MATLNFVLVICAVITVIIGTINLIINFLRLRKGTKNEND